MNLPYDLLTPEQSILLLVDYQPLMIFGIESHDRTLLMNNAVGLAKGAKAQNVPIFLGGISEGYNGMIFAELTSLVPGGNIFRRKSPTFDALEDAPLLHALKKEERPQLVMSGLWTSMCFAFTALRAIREGFTVYGVMDAAGSESLEAHNTAVLRMVHAGVVPVTWMQVVAEWLHDWNAPATKQVQKIYGEHNGYFRESAAYFASLTKKK